ncbi:MAG: TonB family protein [Proteobacteria bacterium]|jgi:protein TonB|nr:TonB family protein [Pseudomonadota bacterium]HOL36373.1 TonB family protein [Rubrivivax sp.]
MAQRQRLRQLSVLQWALLASATVHGALLTVHFVDPVRLNRVFKDTPLEVILVNARGNERPARPQAIAQANLAGGGTLEQGRATSPLPPALVSEPGDAAEDTRRRIEQLAQEQQQLLAQLRREVAALPPPDARRDSSAREEHEREEHRRRLLRQLAEIEKRVNDENARPKTRYISPAAREEIYALYYDHLRRRIEERGTRDFPEHRGRKLYGELVMNITVDALGRVVDAEIVRASRSRVLDARAIAIVRAAAPFGAFDAPMRAQADQIVVTSRFRFTRDEGLETTLSAQ